MTTVDLVFLDSRVARRAGAKAPRLRFDRVVLSVLGRLRARLDDVVPRGVTVVVTITAPILLAAKTTAVLEERIPKLLGKRGARLGRFTGTVHGNQVQIRFMRSSGRTTAAKLAGFVHNRDSDPSVLFDSIGALLRQIDAGERTSSRAGPRAARSANRWLVVASNDEPSWVKTYKHVCAQLFAQTQFERILFVDADLRVSSSGD